MKAAGAVLTVLAFLAAGVCCVWAKKAHIRALRELCVALERMRGELALRATAMPELCALLSENCPGMAQTLFSAVTQLLPQLGEEEFAALWQKAVRQCCTSLQSGEREALLELGEVLGRFELETQLHELDVCIATLRENRECAEHAYPGERRLYLGLSAAAGALLTIVLL